MTAKSVLLVDDDCDVLLTVGEQCRDIGLRVRTAEDLVAALDVIEQQMPDLICINLEMPSCDALRFCGMLANGSDTGHIPIVALARRYDAATYQACRHIKAHYLPQQWNGWPELRRLIERLLRLQATRGPSNRSKGNGSPSASAQGAAVSPAVPAPRSPTVVVADGDADVVDLMTEQFTQLGCLAVGVEDARQAVSVVRRLLPDLVCIDADLPAGNGLSVHEMMASDQLLSTIPVIVLIGATNTDTERHCDDAMAHYVKKDGELWSRVAPLACRLLGLAEWYPAVVPGTE
jgi:CheY-like chemotaxis protein